MNRLLASIPVVAVLAVFGAAYSFTNPPHRMLMWDEAEYASIGRSIARGDGYAMNATPNSLRPPVVPIAAAAGIAIGGPGDAPLRWVSLTFALFALLTTYWCAARAYGPSTGVVAAVILGLSSAFWRSSGLLLTEIPFMACFTGAVVCFYFGLYRHERWFHASWLWWAMAFLTRYTAVLFAPVAAVFVVAALLSRAPGTRDRIRSRAFIAAPCLGGLVVLPWLIRQHLVFGDAFIGVREAATQLQRFMPELSMPWHFYASHLPELLSMPVVLIVGAGAVLAAVRRDRFSLHCLAACAVVLVWMSLYRFKEVRMAMGVLPLLAIVGAAGLSRPWPGTTTSRAIAVPLVVLTALFAVQLRTVRQALASTVTLGYPSFLPAMDFLRAHARPDSVIVGANYPQIHWYADRVTIDLPERSQLGEALAVSEWIVLTNFERGQKEYAGDLLRHVVQEDVRDGRAAVFQDERYQTVLIRSTLLRERRR